MPEEEWPAPEQDEAEQDEAGAALDEAWGEAPEEAPEEGSDDVRADPVSAGPAAEYTDEQVDGDEQGDGPVAVSDQPAEDPLPPLEPAEPTGHPAVDAVLADLDGLEERPVHEHVAAFEQAHAGLRRALDASQTLEPDPTPEPTPDPTPDPGAGHGGGRTGDTQDGPAVAGAG